MAVWFRVALAALALSACSLHAPDPKADALATSAFDQLRQGDLPKLVSEMSLEDFGPNATAKLEAMRASLPEGDPQPGRLTGIYSNSGTGGTVLALTYYYVYPDARVTARTLMAKDDVRPSGWIIRDFTIGVARSAPAEPAPQQPKPAPSRPPTKPQVT
jgi:hypothetical protein